MHTNRPVISKKHQGFTLIELMVAMAISAMLVLAAATTYNIFRNAIARDQSRADLSQNIRVLVDRLSREIRQTPDIVTAMPSSSADTSVTQPGAIEFEDGHAQDLTYHSYYLPSGSKTVEMDTVEYYFSSAPSVRVHWDSVPSSGNTLVRHVISTQDVADDVQGMKFYGPHPLQIFVTTADVWNQTLTIRTVINPRNI